jgi:hypothetical protein
MASESAPPRPSRPFTPGIQIGSSPTLTGVSGNTATVATTGTLTTAKLLTVDASGNTISGTGSGSLGFTFPAKAHVTAALCNNATPATAWNLPTSSAPAASCNTGKNIQEGTLDFADGQSAQFGYLLPSDWTSTIDARLAFFDSSTSGTVIFQIATSCDATSGSSIDDLAFNTPDNFATIMLNATANALWETSKTGVNTTGCSAGNKMQIKISRATDTAAGVARVVGLELTTRRAI